MRLFRACCVELVSFNTSNQETALETLVELTFLLLLHIYVTVFGILPTTEAAILHFYAFGKAAEECAFLRETLKETELNLLQNKKVCITKKSPGKTRCYLNIKASEHCPDVKRILDKFPTLKLSASVLF